MILELFFDLLCIPLLIKNKKYHDKIEFDLSIIADEDYYVISNGKLLNIEENNDQYYKPSETEAMDRLINIETIDENNEQ